MRFWQLWWRTLVFSTQYNPPEFVEHLMMIFAMVLGVKWGFTDKWPYLVLSSSFATGAAISIWVRERLIPSPRTYGVPVAAALLLVSSLSAFAYLAHSLFVEHSY